jgi:hypothetical protein
MLAAVAATGNTFGANSAAGTRATVDGTRLNTDER